MELNEKNELCAQRIIKILAEEKRTVRQSREIMSFVLKNIETLATVQFSVNQKLV